MSPRKATRRPRRDAADAVLGARGREHLEGRRHRRGIGVVALVDQRHRAVEPARAEQHPPARAAPLGRAPARQRQRRARDVAAERLDRREDAERVHREMPPGRGELEEEGPAPGARLARPCPPSETVRLDQAELRPAGRAEAHDPRAGPRAAACRMPVAREVAQHDRRAARLEPGVDRGLLARDAVEVGEGREMHRARRSSRAPRAAGRGAPAARSRRARSSRSRSRRSPRPGPCAPASAARPSGC